MEKVITCRQSHTDKTTYKQYYEARCTPCSTPLITILHLNTNNAFFSLSFFSFIYYFFFFSPRVGFTPSRIQARVDTSPSIYGQIRGNVGHGTQRQYWRVHDLRETKSRCLNANFRGGRCITNALEGMKVTSGTNRKSLALGSDAVAVAVICTSPIYNVYLQPRPPSGEVRNSRLPRGDVFSRQRRNL